jgi:hypothetical protein
VIAHLHIERFSGNEHRSVSGDGTVEGACPGCGVAPFRIQTPPPEKHDSEMRAGARCVACNDPVGWVYVEESRSIFGEEEDRAVMRDFRGRVYGMQGPRG